jgi:RNA polymerase sigma factor (sigma-70 family)
VSANTIQTPPQSVVDVLYDGLARRLEQIVRADVRAPETVVEDACQFAWGSLVAQVARVHSEATLAWLTKTAVREAWRLMRARERDLPLEIDEDDAAELATLVAPAEPDTLVEDREQLRLMRLLPERQQRILWLQGLGLSYDEISAYTGDSTRTVERQLFRARRRLRELSNG